MGRPQCKVQTIPNVMYIFLREIKCELLVRKRPKFHQAVPTSLPVQELFLCRRHLVYSFFTQCPIDLLVNEGRVESELQGERRDFI